MISSLSVYFYAGDFVEALRRHAAGEEQSYATHNEVALLAHDLRKAGIATTFYSYFGGTRSEKEPYEGIRVISLGAQAHHQTGLFVAAVEADGSDAIIPHFPNPDLLNAVLRKAKPAIVVMADSFNERGPRHWLRKKRMVRILNDPGFDLVGNHCVPATELLADMGVLRNKLVAYDFPHRFKPSDFPVKTSFSAGQPRIAYAGTISEDKGVGDLIRAIALLRQDGIEVTCDIAGAGDVAAMEACVRTLGLGDAVQFLGIVPNNQVFDLFRGADLVAVPSRHKFGEGFPLTMFEALASRTPIICSDHPVFRPIMTGNAAMYRAGGAGEFARAIRSALTTPGEYERLSMAAIASWDRLSPTRDWRAFVTDWARGL